MSNVKGRGIAGAAAVLLLLSCGGGGGAPVQGPRRDLGSAAVAFGDSVTEGYGASDNQFAYANVIARRNGWTLTNRAQGGDQLADQAAWMYLETAAADSNYFLLTGYNDMRQSGTDSEGLAYYRNALSATMAWLALPESVKVRATGDNVAYTGLWSSSPPYIPMGKTSGQNGATAAFSVAGSVIYIGAAGEFGGTGAFSLTVDGADKGSWSCAAARRSASGYPYAPFLVRLAGLSAGRHDVVLTVTSVAGDVIFDWAAGNGSLPAPLPFVYVGNTLRMRADAYALPLNPTTPGRGSDAAVALYNAAIQEVCDTLSADGLNVLCVDASAVYDPETADVSADIIHPSDQGMAKIADAFITVMWR